MTKAVHKPYPSVLVAGVPVAPSASLRRGAGLGEVHWDPDSFWGERQEINASATFAHCLAWMERLGWLENFDRVARGDHTTERPGWQFSDSELYKLLEGMAWELGRRPDRHLEATYQALVARVAAVQDPDGYVSTAFGHPGLPERYSDLAMGHELYTLGHLLQAAVARLRTVGEDELVRVARRAADHLCVEFAPGAREAICGHPEIEVALVEFGRATSELRYIELARTFVERRGFKSLTVRPLMSAEYWQDEVPVREAEVLRGHAVRALYLSAGAVDVATEFHDDELLEALARQWERTVSRRTYITGGMGSRHQDEGFGEDWELPPDRAYCETCAGIASVMFSWRLFLATGEVRYIDLIDRTLHNVIATSQRPDGKAFFYANPLHQREQPQERELEGVNMRAEGGARAAWFDVSCCPTNVARTLASIETYACAVEDNTVSLLLYSSGDLRMRVGDDTVALRVDTGYPYAGRVRVTVVEAPTRPVTLRMRIPDWSTNATVAVGGHEATRAAAGWWDVTRAFVPGEQVTLDLDLRPRFTFPDPRIDAVRGSVAVESGPLVMCAESVDLPEDVAIDSIFVDADEPLRPAGEGVEVVVRTVAGLPVERGVLPYAASQPLEFAAEHSRVRLVPYHLWAERGPSTMRVFLPLVGSHGST